MKRICLGAAATAALVSAAAAQPWPGRQGGPVGILSEDEIRDYHRDQLESRQEMQRRALELRQKAERRALDPDDDDD